MLQPSENSLYIGLMSGTSMDGMDAALVEFNKDSILILDQISYQLPPSLKNTLQQLCRPGANEIEILGQCDRELGLLFAETVIELLKKNNLRAENIRAIGSHGQTIRHNPSGPRPFTLQIGDPNTIAENTGITTVADFRRRDIAAGGEGAPLVPAFHQAVFAHPSEQRFIINIGGIANITRLVAGQPTIGFDTGPGNGLLDDWIYKHKLKPCDLNGDWGRSGKIDLTLSKALKADPYFAQSAPKSTGKEYFNLSWLQQYLADLSTTPAPEDVQATLTDLTAWSISREIVQLARETEFSAFVCGGGCHNQLLMDWLRNYLTPASLSTTAELGVAPDWVEAIAFAWLAQQTLNNLPGNEPAVTGAKHPVILGGIYPA